jgi:hypothetical protein
VIDGLSDQLGITDVSCVNQYVEREKTKREHRREICKVVGWRDYADMTQDLLRWLDHRTWNSGESSQVLFWGAVDWLRQRKVLLPGERTLIDDVRNARRAANERLWSELIDQIDADQASRLVRLLDVSQESNKSALEVLRRGPVDRTGKALVGALNRVVEISQIGVGGVDIWVVPQRRVRELARDGMVRNATALRRRLPYEKQLATLLGG